MKTITLLVFALLLLSPLVLSQQEDPRFYHPQSTNLTISEKCRVNGALCDEDYSCYLTILTPAQEYLVDNVSMTGPAVYYTYDLNTSQTDTNGLYESTVDCSNSTLSGSNTFFYVVNPDGTAPIDEGQGLILLGGVILIMLIAFCIGWMGFRFNHGAVGLSFISFSVLLFVFGVGMVLNILESSFSTFTNIINNYSTIYTLFIILVGIGGFALIVWLVVFSLRLYWKNRGMTDPAFKD